MNEADYWINLEYRVCSEFEGMPENYLRYLWCDGFIAEQYLLDDPIPRITGRAWICNGSRRQDEWEFTLVLPHPIASRDEVKWELLLPSESVTQWLTVDQRSKRIQIEPSAAVPHVA